tara:strand:+ start:237 stop:1316 length:1080 start_codon:yes stop_codon:yes gene_type:complete
MANAAASRLGQINVAGDVKAIFLKKFAGEVLTTFEETNVMKALHTVRTINNGKSAQFPVTGTASAAYHVVGEDIVDSTTEAGIQKIKHAEVIINIDELLVASTFIANLDELRNHYDVRSIYSTELGRALANKFDRQVIQTSILNSAGFNGGGAATPRAATIDGGKGSSVVYNNTSTGTDSTDKRFVLGAGNGTLDTDGKTMADCIYAAAQLLDEKDVPASDRYCLVSPQRYYNLVQATDGDTGNMIAINRDWDGNGSYSKGTVAQVAGITVIKTNHLPTGDVTAETGHSNTYTDTFGSNIMGLVFHKSAVGTVKLQDLATESEYQIQRQGTLMVAKYAMGHGGLRPECGVVLMNNDEPS